MVAKKDKPLRGAWRNLIHDIRCGIHSGIPACCIAFFVGHWAHGFSEDKQAQYITRHRKKLREAGLMGYVACPDCLETKNFTTLKPCACEKLTGRGMRQGGHEN